MIIVLFVLNYYTYPYAGWLGNYRRTEWFRFLCEFAIRVQVMFACLVLGNNEIPQRFNTVSLMLQDSQLDLNSAISLFDSVIEFTALQRSTLVRYICVICLTVL